jgi:hypothetical protein
MALMCQFEVSMEAIETTHTIKFDEYFKLELAELKQFVDEGLVEITPEWVSVTPKGKLLIRAIAMTFDRYLRADERARRYSKIVGSSAPAPVASPCSTCFGRRCSPRSRPHWSVGCIARACAAASSARCSCIGRAQCRRRRLPSAITAGASPAMRRSARWSGCSGGRSSRRTCFRCRSRCWQPAG